jgi:purine-nucleoside phosphorylase
MNPLRGPNEESFGVRFPPLSDAYDLALRRRAHDAWAKLDLPSGTKPLQEGVYAFSAGPTYETRAECRMFSALGADLVGMSTVPEVIVARHSGIKVLALSLVTNNCLLDPSVKGNDPSVKGLDEKALHDLTSKGAANHLEVLAAGRLAAARMQTLVSLVIDGLYA